MIFAVVFSVISLKLPPEKSYLPNEYTSTANMLINDSSSSGGGLSSMLSSSGLSGLAGLAGISAGGSTYSSLAIYLTKSNSLLMNSIHRKSMTLVTDLQPVAIIVVKKTILSFKLRIYFIIL